MVHEEILGPDSRYFWLNKSWKRHTQKYYPNQQGLPRMDKGFPCVSCGRDDQVFPSPSIVLCPQCVQRAYPGSMRKVIRRVLDLGMDGARCDFCGRRKIQMFTVYAYICHKCTLAIANRQRGFANRRSIGARW